MTLQCYTINHFIQTTKEEYLQKLLFILVGPSCQPYLNSHIPFCSEVFTHALDMLVSLLNAMSGELLNTSAAEDVKRSSVVKKLMVSVLASLVFITPPLFPCADCTDKTTGTAENVESVFSLRF